MFIAQQFVVLDYMEIIYFGKNIYKHVFINN